MDDDQERAELQSLMNAIPDEEEVAVNAIPLATKPLSIVDWKIGRIIRIKRLLDDLRFTAIKCNLVLLVYVSTARVKLVLLVKIEENILSSYYCLYTVNVAGVLVTTDSV
ncbi:hypothetical protein Tco_0184981 [Tanacetum coccineum]